MDAIREREIHDYLVRAVVHVTVYQYGSPIGRVNDRESSENDGGFFNQMRTRHDQLQQLQRQLREEPQHSCRIEHETRTQREEAHIEYLLDEERFLRRPRARPASRRRPARLFSLRLPAAS